MAYVFLMNLMYVDATRGMLLQLMGMLVGMLVGS